MQIAKPPTTQRNTSNADAAQRAPTCGRKAPTNRPKVRLYEQERYADATSQDAAPQTKQEHYENQTRQLPGTESVLPMIATQNVHDAPARPICYSKSGTKLHRTTELPSAPHTPRTHTQGTPSTAKKLHFLDPALTADRRDTDHPSHALPPTKPKSQRASPKIPYAGASRKTGKQSGRNWLIPLTRFEKASATNARGANCAPFKRFSPTTQKRQATRRAHPQPRAEHESASTKRR